MKKEQILISLIICIGIACSKKSDAPVPEEMVYIDGKEGSFGSPYGLPSEKPVITKEIKSFYLDKSPVTVAEFEKFIKDTGYQTTADSFGDAGVFGGEIIDWLLQGDSAVAISHQFKLAAEANDSLSNAYTRVDLETIKESISSAVLNQIVQQPDAKVNRIEKGDSIIFKVETHKWILLKGANWKYPLGPEQPSAQKDHPVTQVSWYDARSYCNWAGKRLVNEFEWELAAQSLPESKKYAWGDVLADSSGFKANVWQGSFPTYNLVQDGFIYTSPVGYFDSLSNGLTDMGGNVWEWTSSNYTRSHNAPVQNPLLMTLKGGSFLCDSNVCHGYRFTARQHCTKETSLMHQGFRCAKDIE